jgi:LPS O-antigen subunit length determinant protein (WzzB/FepE family)
MTENKEYTQAPANQETEEQEIDLMEYARKLWLARKVLFKAAGIAAVLGVIIALTTPRQYTVNVTLAPESGKSGGSLSSIASMFGVGGMSIGNDADALNVMLYPNILESTPFILDLMDTQVKTIDEELPDTTLTGYLTEYTSNSLMSNVISLPFRALGGLISLFVTAEEEQEPDTINPFLLTKEQANIVKAIKQLVVANVDKKTGITTISVTMQDPMVAAIMTDTVVYKLKEHITKYRVSKAEEDYKYWEKLYHQHREEYFEAQKNYAEYTDANKDVILQSVSIEQERLQNEMSLAFQTYSNVANQLQMAKAKVQEAKPVFALVEPATVPLKPSGRGRASTVIITVFLIVAATGAWILFGKDFMAQLKAGLKDPKEGQA